MNWSKKPEPQRKLDSFFTPGPPRPKRERPEEEPQPKAPLKPQKKQAHVEVKLDNTITELRPLHPLNEVEMPGLTGFSNALTAGQIQHVESLIEPHLAKVPLSDSGYRRCVLDTFEHVQPFYRLGFSTHIEHNYDVIKIEEFRGTKSGYLHRPETREYSPYCTVISIGSTWPLCFASKSLAEREVMYMMRNGCLLRVEDPAYSKAERRVPAQQNIQGRFFGSRFEKGKRKEEQCRRDAQFRMLHLSFYFRRTEEEEAAARQHKRSRYQ